MLKPYRIELPLVKPVNNWFFLDQSRKSDEKGDTIVNSKKNNNKLELMDTIISKLIEMVGVKTLTQVQLQIYQRMLLS